MIQLSVSRFTRKALLAGSLVLSLCGPSTVFGQKNTTTVKWFEEKAWLNGLQLTPHKSIDQQDSENNTKQILSCGTRRLLI